jgi:hypothetical protein
MFGDESARSRTAPTTSSTVTDTEEGRAFFQARLALFGFCVFVLAGGSWAALTLLSLIASAAGQAARHPVLSPGSVLHFANAALGAVLWLATRNGPLSGRKLQAFDLVVSLTLVTIWGLAGITIPEPIVGGFIALLSFIVGFLARAIVVPSTAERTFLVGALGSAVIITFAVLRGDPSHSPLIGAVATACWCASAVTLATVASRIIFGLRREVAAARVFGQYTLVAKLGEGGMGSVWRANHALLRRPTALKLLPPGRAADASIRRFEREVQLTAQLTHPGTVAVYDYGRTRDGIFYYAMELIEGADLQRLVTAHGSLPPERVVHLLVEVCGALAEAHDLGLVHRDVKPANILVAPRRNEHEFAKIVDFGLVKNIQTEPTANTVSAVNTITGTPLYMSPEAIRDPENIDGRSDLYALGAVAWFLLVGRPVFEGENIVAVCSQHLHEPPRSPSSELGSPVPPDLEAVVLACLAKDRSARPADARELRRMLLACECASRWTAERARSFWQSDFAARRPADPAEPGARTIALELASRIAS